MDDWAQGRVEGDGRSLHWYRSGGDKPPLLLVHGFTDNARYFSRAARALAADWDVVAYDCRGHGRSDRAEGRFAESDRVADLVAVVRGLGLDRPAMLGHSMGAATIAAAVASHPGLSRGIVLEDPAWWEPPASTPEQEAQLAELRRRGNEAWRDSIVEVQAMTRDEGLAWRRKDSPLWSDEDVALSYEARLDVEIDLFTYFPAARAPWREIVDRFDCPALLVIGENERGGIISVAHAEEAADRQPLLRWAQVTGVGHAIRYDDLDGFLAAVLPFLDELR